MCASYIERLACGCDVAKRCPINGCDGRCAQALYDETRDVNSSEICERHSYISPPTSSDESASETSEVSEYGEVKQLTREKNAGAGCSPSCA